MEEIKYEENAWNNESTHDQYAPWWCIGGDTWSSVFYLDTLKSKLRIVHSPIGKTHAWEVFQIMLVQARAPTF